MEAQVKTQMLQMLQAQIAAIQSQIQALQQQQTQQQIQSKDGALNKAVLGSEESVAARRSNLSTLGSQVDTYA